MKNIEIITQHWGEINPLKIEDYLRVGGYAALDKFIKNLTPGDVLKEIKKSKLCGRGGAGFPTGDKWEMVMKQEEDKFLICNLDESEPGTYKDRLIIDNNPHLLLEGIIISALTVGAKKAYIYINGNYKKQAEILEQALSQAENKRYLGRNILGSEHNLQIEIFSGAGAYICGEETALINSMEGNRGEPKLKPPYPTEKGLSGKSTVINNAETLANIPWIVLNSGEKYSQIGNPNSPGTKIFLLSGSVKKTGYFELPTGVTVRQLIFENGNGMSKGKDFWFAQIGGACGKLLLENELDAELFFGKNCGCPLGSGSVLVVDKSVNIYDLLLSWAEFFKRESCGKCVPCREGTFRLHEIVERLKDGEISDRDKEALEDILWTLKNTTFCSFGKFAAVAFEEAIKKLNILA